MTAHGLREVRILDVPADVVLQTLRHLQDLLHELRIVQVGHDSGQAEVGPQMAALMDEILGSYGDAQQAVWQQATEAVESGRPRIDLVLELPPEAAEASTRLLQLLEEADALCRAGDLLTVAAPPEVVALRRWWSGQMVGQMNGEPPEPCPL